MQTKELNAMNLEEARSRFQDDPELEELREHINYTEYAFLQPGFALTAAQQRYPEFILTAENPTRWKGKADPTETRWLHGASVEEVLWKITLWTPKRSDT
jgi:hypothetical protein